MIRRFIQKYSLNQYQYDPSQSLDKMTSCKDFIFRELRLDDFDKSPIFYEKDRKKRYISHRMKGHLCYGFESSSGTIAAYFWLTIGKANPAFKQFDWLISNNEAYIWDCRTALDYQRQGLYKEGLKNLVYICQKMNIKKIMISSEPSNSVSAIGIKSVGFVYQGKITAITTKIFTLIFRKGKGIKVCKPLTPVVTKDVFPWI